MPCSLSPPRKTTKMKTKQHHHTHTRETGKAEGESTELNKKNPTQNKKKQKTEKPKSRKRPLCSACARVVCAHNQHVDCINIPRVLRLPVVSFVSWGLSVFPGKRRRRNEWWRNQRRRRRSSSTVETAANHHHHQNRRGGRAPRHPAAPLEAVETALLLLLGDGVHALLEARVRNLGVAPLAPLLLHLLQAPPVVLLRLVAQVLDLALELARPPPPRLAVRLDLVLLPLQVRERLLERRRQLLLGREVLLDQSDAGFLVFLDLGGCNVLAGRPGGWGCRRAA